MNQNPFAPLQVPVQVQRLHPQAKLPVYATAGSAAADLFALCPQEGIVLAPGQRALIPTGLAMALPSAGFVGLIYIRSGHGIKHGLALSNGVGVIDADYRGELQVGLVNLSQNSYTVKNGERIAQLRIAPSFQGVFSTVDTLEETARGTGGFGSTGTQ